ncbi:hypothetical protein GE061_000855 [Apolygus lucorum]|uniref:Uncharacterized protein n=1 Tax=Apolygus lucorum TaxID=248454 RepID=A0A6A4KG48_APOLU|nr:hypothetical protein GE061_000855 [Apolygus lucorum]
MMSLVAYGNSDESGSDEECEPSNEDNAPSKVVLVSNKELSTSKKEASTSSKSGNPPSKVDKPLSLPSSQITSINFDLKILDKNRSQPIRITIPSLKDLEKEDETDKKPKLKPCTKGSGLFSLLPEPKNVTSSVSKGLVPQSVANAKKPQPNKLIPQKAKTKKQKSSALVDDDDEEGGEPLSSFFFSSSDDAPLPPVDIDVDIPMINSEVGSSNLVGSSNVTVDSHTSGNSSIDTRVLPQNDVPHSSSTGLSLQTSEIEEASLDSAALMKLCGPRGRRKGPDLSEIIEVSGSSLVGDTSLQLAKELSKEQPTHSFKRKSECSSLQRRKHQITYLAEQAKAQELELRNNWAQNRMTRKQTQAKYGF